MQVIRTPAWLWYLKRTDEDRCWCDVEKSQPSDVAAGVWAGVVTMGHGSQSPKRQTQSPKEQRSIPA